MFFLDEVYATKCIPKPVDLQSDRRRSRSSSPGSRDSPSARPRVVSVSSLEPQDQVNASKRNSFFSLRPKSSLTNHSSDASVRSRSPVGITNRRSSSMARERPISPAEGDESQPGLIFTRNSKNSWISVRPLSPMDADDEGEAKRRNRILHKRGLSGEPKRNLIKISSPFGFRHIASIGKENLSSTMKVPNATTHPPSGEVKSGSAARINESTKVPPPLRPKRSDERLAEVLVSPPPPIEELRRSRFAELVDHSDRILRPQPIAAISLLSPSSQHSSNRSTVSGQVVVGRRAGETHVRLHIASELTLSGDRHRLAHVHEAKGSLGKRDTTYPAQVHPGPMPEDKPSPPTFASFSCAPLEQVPEEPEGTVSSRQSMEVKSKTFNRLAKSLSTLHGQDPTQEEEEEEEEQQQVPLQEELPPRTQAPHGSDTLGNSSSAESCESPLEAPALPRRNSLRRRRRKEAPKALMDIDSNWEDDIDFCYEHRAEANCNFDWNNMSILKDASSDDEPEMQEDLPWQRKKRQAKQDEKESVDRISSGNAKRSRQVNGTSYNMPIVLPEDAVPELDGQSAHTCSTNSFSALTFTDRRESVLEAIAALTLDSSAPICTSPQLSPLDVESPMTTEQMYHELLSGNNLPDESRSTPLEIPSKSILRQSSLKFASTPQPAQEKDLLSFPLAAVNNSDQPPKSISKLSLGAMVAMIRRTSDSGVSVTTEERKSRTLSRSSTNSHNREPSLSTAEPVPPTPTLPKPDTVNIASNTTLNLPEIDVAMSNWSEEFKFESAESQVLGMNYKGWHSTPALLALNPSFANTTRADSPPASPSFVKGLGINTNSSPTRHSLIVREPKTPLPPPSPPPVPPKDVPQEGIASPPRSPAILDLSIPHSPMTVRTGRQSYSLFPYSSSSPGTPRIVERRTITS